MTTWRVIKNFFRKALPSGSLTSDKYIPFGTDDCWPLKWADIIENSPSAASCLSTVKDFLEGFGFSDTDLEKKVVNTMGETLWQVHQKTVESYSQYWGFYWLLRFDGAGRVADWRVLDFENCRFGKPDSDGWISHVFYNPFFGTPFYNGTEKKETKIYDVWNIDGLQDQILRDGEGFKGQVFYFGATSPLSRYYPKPEPISSKRWMQIEDGVSKYHEGNINRGFLQKFMMTMYGDPDQPSTNPDYQDWNNGKPATVGEEFEDMINKEFMGVDNSNNLFINWVQNMTEKPQLDAFPNAANGDLFITLDTQAIKKITIAWKVPAILANINEGVSLGGDGNTVRVAVKLMQQRVIKRQRHLTDAYQMILKAMPTPYVQDVVIVPYNPYPELEVIDDKIWNALTVEERRKWIQDNTEIELIEEDLVTDPALLPQNKITNALPIQWPDKVLKTMNTTKEYTEKMQLKCTGRWLQDLSDRILTNQNIGLRETKRIFNYLKKNGNLANRPYNEGCDIVAYNRLGGKEMFDFLDSELKRFESWLN